MVDKQSRSIDIRTHIPLFLRETEPFEGLFQVLNQEFESADSAFVNLKNQFSINTAVEGLRLWEAFLGIKVDENKSLEFRRSVILSKIRGVGKVTKTFLEETCKSYENGALEVVELPAENHLILKFTELNGTPPNEDDFKAFVAEVVPAHLTYEFVNKFNTHGEVNRLTHSDLRNMTHIQMRETNDLN